MASSKNVMADYDIKSQRLMEGLYNTRDVTLLRRR